MADEIKPSYEQEQMVKEPGLVQNYSLNNVDETRNGSCINIYLNGAKETHPDSLTVC